ncbi:polyketide synthase [Streptomyces viridochromogenes DSM 40736]|uniref:Polyketide synthase n=1 Tax=Streptomyces viridochromogenes (strain DSM 40736 / JCM 4977 / BCRC 1201 / Tue 494) TaxID=591159 RepID=D9XDI8_STRVT|nr:polyketide synthase [Streptomyces viridochromogenes DSM 40736]
MMNEHAPAVDRHSGDNEPIAVVGLACRLPGADGPAAFWELLGGTSAITDVPRDRWGAGEPSAVRRGGFLDDVAGFDASFFAVSPREAAAMDPQQRLVLELVWEALEDAGILPASLRSTRTSVFVGTLRDDYTNLLYQRGTDAIGQHTMTGVNRGVIANRVSYHLGLHGPSLTVDAAQSSSLVAVHLACESLRSGESTTAIAAGVNLNLLAENTVTEQRFGALSPDGVTYTFDARANGFVPGEGGGVVLLKPLRQAVADGDRVYGVIRGSAVNNDGATDGLTVPSRAAQEEVLRTAYQRAEIAAGAVQYVELHGTGTPVGDPVEAAALGAVLGAGRPEHEPLRVGSVKTNIGHLEGAAGIAGADQDPPGPASPEAPSQPQTSRRRTPRSRWPTSGSTCSANWPGGRIRTARWWPASAPSAWAAPTATSCSPKPPPPRTPTTPRTSRPPARPACCPGSSPPPVTPRCAPRPSGCAPTSPRRGRSPGTSPGPWPRPARSSGTGPWSSPPTWRACSTARPPSPRAARRPTWSPGPPKAAARPSCSPARAPSGSAWGRSSTRRSPPTRPPSTRSPRPSIRTCAAPSRRSSPPATDWTRRPGPNPRCSPSRSPCTGCSNPSVCGPTTWPGTPSASSPPPTSPASSTSRTRPSWSRPVAGSCRRPATTAP